GVPVFAYVDAVSAGAGSAFEIEVNRCTPEVEPNDTPATAIALACPVTGGTVPAGDVDFYTLGTPAAGARLFAMVDGVQATADASQLRVARAPDTLEVGADAGHVWLGSTGFGPVTAGRRLGAAPVSLSINHYWGAAPEPYRLYSVLQPAIASAAAEVEPNDTT